MVQGDKNVLPTRPLFFSLGKSRATEQQRELPAPLLSKVRLGLDLQRSIRRRPFGEYLN
ncbi:hypothetical protein EV13_2928 [Prochlorococcus sp. MIT 0702]|nr:hypothetical protein EV12_2874 [Prochlorococcus sp. MIT 0701]KGG26147.1 hypothetical protein EV13_2928 [Prochlorococcus sp. MIT 0702]KGG32971.1 hypothetical protein EV14_1812 [Prochlorococcus sp. MIT 0703]